MNLKKKKKKKQIPRHVRTPRFQLNPIERFFIFGLAVFGLLLIYFVTKCAIKVEKPERPIVILDVNTSRIYYAVDIRYTANDMLDFYDKRTGEHITLEYVGK